MLGRNLSKITVHLLVAVIPVCETMVYAASPVAIIANPGPFGDIKKAAASEQAVNWWDEDTADDDACTESFAALELRHFLAACTELQEQDIRVAKPDRLPEKGYVFILGSRRSNPLIASFGKSEQNRLPLKTPESFHLRALSQDQRTVVLVEGNGRVGTLYGVYAYLEQMGLRFFGLGAKGTVYPDQPAQLPKDLDLAENPHYLTRGFWAWEDRGNDEFFLWMARNRLNFWTAEEKEYHFLKKLGLILTTGQHGIQRRFLNPHREYPYDCPLYQGDEEKPKDPYVPGKLYLGDANKDGKLVYAEAHPEWFALRGGKRNAHQHRKFIANYCTSNKDATHELAGNLVQCLIDGEWSHTDLVNFWMLDGKPWCECEACKKEGTPTDRLLKLIHIMRVEIKKARQAGRLKRNIPLVTLAYLETLSPPTRPLPADFDYDNIYITFFPIRRCYVHPFADPKCTEINRQQMNDYLGWTMGEGRHYQGSIFIGEYYNVSSIKCLPVLFPTIMAADIPWFYHNGARHFHYMHAMTDIWGTWTLNQYLMARLLWNIDTDVDRLLDEYFKRYYPTTAELTRSFYRHLEHATANIKAYKHAVVANGVRYIMRVTFTRPQMKMFPLDHLKYWPHRPQLNDGPDLVEIMEATRKARRAVDDALLTCTDPVEKLRLLEDEHRFEYGEVMFYFYYHLARMAMFHRQGNETLARHEFRYLEQMAERLRGFTTLVRVASSHASAENGFA
ncbi:MAG: DUF4838 domain-containing protein, partial [Planctomycetota bacterium]